MRGRAEMIEDLGSTAAQFILVLDIARVVATDEVLAADRAGDTPRSAAA